MSLFDRTVSRFFIHTYENTSRPKGREVCCSGERVFRYAKSTRLLICGDMKTAGLTGCGKQTDGGFPVLQVHDPVVVPAYGASLFHI